MLTINRQPNAQAFLENAGPFLERQEASHNLIFGLAADLVLDPQRFGTLPVYLATIEENTTGEVVGAALRTPPRALLISLIESEHRDKALSALAADLANVGIPLTGVTAPTEVASIFAGHWAALSGHQAQIKLPMRIYALNKAHPPQGVSGGWRIGAVEDAMLLATWFAAFERETLDEEVSPEDAQQTVMRWLASTNRKFYVWEDQGRLVSMAGCAGPTPHGIRISAVYTPPELRGRGYASACVAAASQDQLDSGRQFCFLFTDLRNPTSNKIYQQIGYEPVCDVDELVFVE